MRRLVMLAVASLAMVVLPQAAATAADFTVNSDGDGPDAVPGDGTCRTAEGVCTLRAAVNEAEKLVGADTITVPAMTISLGSQLSLSKTTTIRGAGAQPTVITGTPGHVLFYISGGDIVIRDLSMKGVTATGGGGLAVNQGGAASTQLIGVQITDNKVDGLPSAYAPVVVTNGEMIIRDSLIARNVTRSAKTHVYGGGIYAQGATTTLTVENSTIHGNIAQTDDGSSTATGGGIRSFALSTTIRSSTITGNSAINGASLSAYGGNLSYAPAAGSSLTVENSVIADGVSTFGIYANCDNGGGTFLGSNVISDTSCGAADAHHTIKAPGLGALRDNGGPTETRSPVLGGPLVDTATTCPTATDQRGQERPVGPACDIGAVELGADLQVSQSVSNPAPAPGADVVLTITVGNRGADDARDTSLLAEISGAQQLVSATPTQGSCRAGLNPLSCDLGTITEGSTVKVLVVVRAPQSGDMTSAARASSGIPDRNPADNSASVTATVPASGPAPAPGPDSPAGVCSNVVQGTAGKDRLAGTPGSDRVTGLGGADRLKALAGNDCVDGGPGNDRVVAGTGDDRAVGGKGRDLIVTGAGADRVAARDGARDVVRCGAGADRAVVDRRDRVAKDCEKVRRR